MNQNKEGFTLIELLIVVAIIAILAAIAIPNFLQAQVRAKVSRTQADMASLATAIEAYCVDNSWYPLYGHVESTLMVEYPATSAAQTDITEFIGPTITTPIAYITSIPQDPFASGDSQPLPYIKEYDYLNLVQHVATFGPTPPPFVLDIIPDWGDWRIDSLGPLGDGASAIKNDVVYNPTNGTVSSGAIVRCQIQSENVPSTGPGTQ